MIRAAFLAVTAGLVLLIVGVVGLVGVATSGPQGGTFAAAALAQQLATACPALTDTTTISKPGTVDARTVSQAAYTAGFRGPDLVTAVAVAHAESGFQPGIVNPVGAAGLWQILRSAHPDLSQWADGTWNTPTGNAVMAYVVWLNAGRSWTPWETYTNGAYQRFLPDASAAVSNLPADAATGDSLTATAPTGSCSDSVLVGTVSGPLGCTPPLARLHIASPYGPRPNLGADGGFHPGTDFDAPEGTPVAAACPGVVATAGPASGYGNYVQVLSAGNWLTAYAHLSQIDVQPGQAVTAGQILGLSGSTGFVTGPHLHFEVRRGVWGPTTDPIPWLAGQGIKVG